MREFLGNFESIGNNCEFGFVLGRLYNGEGSLFRWANVRNYRFLVDAFRGRLDGLYEFDNLTPITLNLVRDSRFGLEFHTEMPIEAFEGGLRFANADERDRPRYHDEFAKTVYLKDKFLKSAAAGGRIYVLKEDWTIGEGLVAEILASLRELGDATILQVSAATPEQPVGSVIRKGDHLLHGFIDHVDLTPDLSNIAYLDWLAVLTEAWRLHQER